MDQFLYEQFLDQFFHWKVLRQGSFRDRFSYLIFFLVHVNDLADSISSNAKLLSDDTSSFSGIHDVGISANEANNDLYQIKINEWVFQWKMNFNWGPSKQTKEIAFSKKI